MPEQDEVWVAETGPYEDVRPVGVYSTLENAKSEFAWVTRWEESVFGGWRAAGDVTLELHRFTVDAPATQS
jgi:hypothetical protein